MKNQSASKNFRARTARAVGILACVLATPTVFAASQTWTNAPVSQSWTNVLNWAGQAVPGGINMTGNTVNGDIATFNSPVPVSGVGGVTAPVLVDDATTTGDRSRQVSGIVFDTTNCGAYVFSGTTPAVYPSTGILYVSHNGSIIMNAPVTSSQTFLLPILTRLPSSTAGIYNFVNNSTNSSATLTFYSITNDSAATRGTTFILSGSNTGTNTIFSLSQDGIYSSGVSAITKQGTGTWILAGSNSFRASAPININNGLLIAENPASLGQATTATVNSNATLQIDGVSLVQTTLTLQLSGTVRINGSVTNNGITVGTASGTAPTLSTTSSGDVMTIGAAANAVTGGSLSSVLHVAGPGTVLLSQSDNYVGQWSADAGTLQLGNAAGLGTGADLNVEAGATFDVSPITTGSGTYALTTAAFSAGGTGTVVGSTAATINADASGTVDLATAAQQITLKFTPTSTTGDTAHPALYVAQGTLKLGGNAFSIDNASGTPLEAGTYTLIQQATGSIIDGGGYSVIGVTGSGLAAGDVASVQVSGGNLDLVISAYVAKNLVWTGGAANANWDIGTDANWLNGASASIFNNSDDVTFNATGSTNPTVTLVGTLAPGNVTVDTTANNYTFSGSGTIAGSTSLTKISSGTLLVQTANTYGGGTVISNGVFQLGVNNAIPDAGGDVALYSPATLDLNSYSDTINGLSGSGIVDSVAGGSPVLTVGNNNDNGIFTGSLQNTAGSLSLTKNGTGVQTLAAANTYTGATTINNGTLQVMNPNSLGSGASAVTINVGATLDIATNEVVASIAGVGTVANNSTSTTNELIIEGASTFNGTIADGPGGETSVLINGGAVRLNGNSTYSGGTYVAAGASFAVGQVLTTTVAGSGPVVASNNAAISLPNTSSQSPGFANPVTTVDGATVTFTSSSTANNYANQFNGSALATNIFAGGNMSIGGALSFSNFLGTVIVSNGEVRMFNASGGGNNTTFDFVSGGGMFTRDADIINLGALFGDNTALITAPSVTYPGTYVIGALGINSVYSGSITGSNNIVKVGAGTLTLNGGLSEITTLNGDGSTSTNFVYTNTVVDCAGSITISNGTLALATPVVLTNSYNGNTPESVLLASPASVLDATSMGYISNQYASDGVTVTNQVFVTNGIFEVVANQTAGGLGMIRGTLLADSGSILNPGNIAGNFTNAPGTGILTVTGSATLNGAVNICLDNTNAVNSGELTAASFTISGATLVVTNVGPALAGGNVFHLFSAGINTNGFASITLPTVSSPMTLSNNLAVDGTLVVWSPVSTSAFSITNVYNGGNLNLSWPADHVGWRLQVQTNSLAVGLANNWTDWPGSTNVSSESIPVNTGNGAVFFRMVYP